MSVEVQYPANWPRLLPVLDIMNRQVVRGVAGIRQNYQPIESILGPSTCPVELAVRISSSFGLNRFYIADLDAIEGGSVHAAYVRHLAARGFELLLDAGVRDCSEIKRLLEVGTTKVVLGLESIPDARLPEQALKRFGADKLIFSLDMVRGIPKHSVEAWAHSSAWKLVNHVIELGYRSLIILDLARVGTRSGLVTIDLLKRVHQRHGGVELISGGGISTPDDLIALRSAGTAEALIATALHDGSISEWLQR